MNSQLIIDVKPKELTIAVLEDGALVELQTEQKNIRYAVGDIILGVVDNVVRGNNAAFVNIGPYKNGFLHYNDLGKVFGATSHLIAAASRKQPLPTIDSIPAGTPMPKEGNIVDSGLKQGDKILVKVTREPFSTKGASLSAELSIAGRFLVLVPFSDQIALSSEIRDRNERRRLREILLAVKPSGYGVIVRTQAQTKKTQEIYEELQELIKRFTSAFEQLRHIKAPGHIYEERSRGVNIIRDRYNSSYTEVVTNAPEYYEELKAYIAEIDPGRESIVTLYKEEHKRPLFDTYGITKQKKTLFGKRISLTGGANIIIEQTEAMHVIDVNSSSKKARKSSGQEETAFEVNMAVAELIARQIRLRDLGGIIVIDFIDMNDPEHNKALYEHMVKLMHGDRATHKILPVSKFGLMQITRQRVREATVIQTEESCPACHGTGKVQSSILFADELEQVIAQLMAPPQKQRHLLMHLHPYIVAYLTRRESLLGQSIYSKWKKTYSKNIKLIENQDLPILSYQIFDKDQNRIEVTK